MKLRLGFLISCLPLVLTIAREESCRIFGNKLFASSVYKQILNNEKSNFLVSPISAETVLALTQFGAKNDSAKELRIVLHLPESQEQIKLIFRNLQPLLNKSQPYSLSSANKIYVKKDFAIKNDFKKIATEIFDSNLENIDFENTEEAVKTINSWVENQTENKLTNIIKPEDLSDKTGTVLINALYFKGNWSKPFKKFRTTKKDFYKNGNEANQVETMHDTNYRKYFESKELDAKFLELPFEGKDATLTIVLPNDNQGLENLENQIDNVLEAPEYQQKYVRLAIPKFKIESQIDFTTILQKLGVEKIFRDDEADLSGIAGRKGDLVVDKILQKTYVDVQEDGVEAAATTSLFFGVPVSLTNSPIPSTEFIADHPFIFYLKIQDIVIFAGRVVNPNQ